MNKGCFDLSKFHKSQTHLTHSFPHNAIYRPWQGLWDTNQNLKVELFYCTTTIARLNYKTTTKPIACFKKICHKIYVNVWLFCTTKICRYKGIDLIKILKDAILIYFPIKSAKIIHGNRTTMVCRLNYMSTSTK